MAIEKHFFTTSSTSANVSEVITWLTENASEYFDTIDNKFGTEDGNTSIFTMRTNNGSYVGVDPTTTGSHTLVKVKSANATSEIALNAPYTNNNPYIAYAVKTSYGIALIGLANQLRIFMTKSNLGTTAVYVMAKSYVSSTSSESMQFVAFDTVNGNSYQKTPSIHSSLDTANKINQGYYQWQNDTASDLTVLAPFVFKGGTYAEHMFVTPFSQYPKIICKINVNGKNYFYDGYVALEE